MKTENSKFIDEIGSNPKLQKDFIFYNNYLSQNALGIYLSYYEKIKQEKKPCFVLMLITRERISGFGNAIGCNCELLYETIDSDTFRNLTPLQQRTILKHSDKLNIAIVDENGNCTVAIHKISPFTRIMVRLLIWIKKRKKTLEN